MKRKGMSNIIAVILLLLITVFMVGATWLWTQKMSENSKNKTQHQMDNLVTSRNIRITAINTTLGSDSYITVKNIGKDPVNSDSIGVYVNGSRGIACNFGTIASNSEANCTSRWISGCGFMKVTHTSGDDIGPC
jgi:flagellin-like protein